MADEANDFLMKVSWRIFSRQRAEDGGGDGDRSCFANFRRESSHLLTGGENKKARFSARRKSGKNLVENVEGVVQGACMHVRTNTSTAVKMIFPSLYYIEENLPFFPPESSRIRTTDENPCLEQDFSFFGSRCSWLQGGPSGKSEVSSPFAKAEIIPKNVMQSDRGVN